MKHDLELSLQAWLDGELPEREAQRMGEWIASDAEAAALLSELRSVKEILPANETPRAVPDTREFYWSQIQRRIGRDAKAARPARLPWYARWHGYLLPLTGVAALACALVVTLRHPLPPSFDEISATSDVMEAVTFHDQSGQMTVVWLQDNNPQTAPEYPAQNVKSTIQPSDESDGEMD
jgi:anti-sigma factor RsiW